MILNIIAKSHGVEVDVERIKKSIQLILKSGISYEFRTTVYPKYVGLKNVVKIAQYLKSVGSKKYVLQNYYSKDNSAKPYAKDVLFEMKKACQQYLPTELKGIL